MRRTRMQAEAIGRLLARNAAGAMLPLSSFVTVTLQLGPDRVIHYNGYPSADISGGALPRRTVRDRRWR